jgi:hypothetical protein
MRSDMRDRKRPRLLISSRKRSGHEAGQYTWRTPAEPASFPRSQGFRALTGGVVFVPGAWNRVAIRRANKGQYTFDGFGGDPNDIVLGFPD